MTGMTYDDIAELLAFCAVYDQRKGDDLDIQAWLMVATDHRWTRDAAFRVAREHYGHDPGRPRLDPAKVTERIRQVRSSAAATFELPRIPEDLADRDYPTWLRARRDAHVDALLAQWAATGADPSGQPPPAPPADPIGQRRVHALVDGAFHDVPAAERPTAAVEPADPDAPVRRGALVNPCPYCEARPGEHCTRSGINGRVRLANPHPARVQAQTEQAAS